jgi:hypothetical protein
MQAQRVGSSIALLTNAAREWIDQCNAPPALPPGKTRVRIVKDDEWASGLVWTGTENLVPPPRGLSSGPSSPVASRITDDAVLPSEFRVTAKYYSLAVGVINPQHHTE